MLVTIGFSAFLGCALVLALLVLADTWLRGIHAWRSLQRQRSQVLAGRRDAQPYAPSAGAHTGFVPV